MTEETEPNPVGCPLKFESPQMLEVKIDEYYKWAKDNSKPLTIERLACFLEVDRHTINNYEKREKDEFFTTIKKARQFILADKMERLNGGVGSTAGVIFDLKNNHALVDKREIENSGEMTFNERKTIIRTPEQDGSDPDTETDHSV